MRSLDLPILAVVASVGCGTAQQTPPECPRVEPAPIGSAPNASGGPAASSEPEQCPTPVAPATPEAPANAPAPALLVNNTCFIANIGAELFFYEVEHENTVWSFHCMAERHECSGASFHVGDSGKPTGLMDLSTASASIVEWSQTRLQVQHGRYTFDFDESRALVLEYIDGKQVAAIPCDPN